MLHRFQSLTRSKAEAGVKRSKMLVVEGERQLIDTAAGEHTQTKEAKNAEHETWMGSTKRKLGKLLGSGAVDDENNTDGPVHTGTVEHASAGPMPTALSRSRSASASDRHSSSAASHGRRAGPSRPVSHPSAVRSQSYIHRDERQRLGISQEGRASIQARQERGYDSTDRLGAGAPHTLPRVRESSRPSVMHGSGRSASRRLSREDRELHRRALEAGVLIAHEQSYQRHHVHHHHRRRDAVPAVRRAEALDGADVPPAYDDCEERLPSYNSVVRQRQREWERELARHRERSGTFGRFRSREEEDQQLRDSQRRERQGQARGGVFGWLGRSRSGEQSTAQVERARVQAEERRAQVTRMRQHMNTAGLGLDDRELDILYGLWSGV